MTIMGEKFTFYRPFSSDLFMNLHIYRTIIVNGADLEYLNKLLF